MNTEENQQNASADKPFIIELNSSSGVKICAEVINTVSIHDRRFVLLQTVETSALTAMELVSTEDDLVFRQIDDDELYDIVVSGFGEKLALVMAKILY
jgi:hypothetical protein